MITLIARSGSPGSATTTSPGSSYTFSLGPSPIQSSTNSPTSSSTPSQAPISGSLILVAALVSVIIAVSLIICVTCLVIRVRQNQPPRYARGYEFSAQTPIPPSADHFQVSNPSVPKSPAPGGFTFPSTMVVSRASSPAPTSREQSTNGNQNSLARELPGSTTWSDEALSSPPAVWNPIDGESRSRQNR
jgi:hypothetical protein